MTIFQQVNRYSNEENMEIFTIGITFKLPYKDLSKEFFPMTFYDYGLLKEKQVKEQKEDA